METQPNPNQDFYTQYMEQQNGTNENTVQAQKAIGYGIIAIVLIILMVYLIVRSKLVKEKAKYHVQTRNEKYNVLSQRDLNELSAEDIKFIIKYRKQMKIANVKEP